MDISVVVPTHNRRWLLEKSLPTLLTQELAAAAWELIVVVDGATDGSGQYARELGARVIEQANRGIASARNAGWRSARAPLVLFIDDDILCSPGLLRAHIAAHRGRDLAVVKGAVPNARDIEPSLVRDWAFAHGERWMREISGDDRVPWPRYATVDANTSVLRGVLERVGGYDESFRAREQVELALRLGKLGAEFCYERRAVGWHYYTKTTSALIDRDAERYGREEVRLCRRHPEFRRHSALASLGEGGWLKRSLRLLGARSLRLHRSLRPPLRAAEWLHRYRAARTAGMRLLQTSLSSAMFAEAANEAGGWDALEREFGQRLPVLSYENVALRAGSDHSEPAISPPTFSRHLEWLKRGGYSSIQSWEWRAWVAYGRSLPPKSVLITFERPHMSLHEHALPVLQSYGLTGLIFVPPQTTEASASGMMAPEQLREWASRGMEFGAAGRGGRSPRGLPTREVEMEVRGHRDHLEALLGRPVLAFAYPGDDCDDVTRDVVARHFELAFTRTPPGVNYLATDLHALRRTGVETSTRQGSMREWISGRGGRLRREARREIAGEPREMVR